MGAQHHYVSKFHLRGFLDPDSLTLKDPWLWQGFIPDGPVKRRAPKNVGTKSLMFDGSGGLGDRDTTLESFLANKIEGSAAKAMREVCARRPGTDGDFPPELFRYLAWAAARSLPMQKLFTLWISGLKSSNQEVVEPPPNGVLAAFNSQRDIAMVHTEFGACTFPHDADFDTAERDGWRPDFNDPDNFLEAVHLQAYYFQARFFQRLDWFTLHAPNGEFFVLADRSVGWAANGVVDAPPSYLRHPSAYVLAPISRSLVLVGCHQVDQWKNVTADRVNAITSQWAHEWIVGPTEQIVCKALIARGAGWH